LLLGTLFRAAVAIFLVYLLDSICRRRRSEFRDGIFLRIPNQLEFLRAKVAPGKSPH